MENLDEVTIDLAKQLIRKESISPNDGGCQQLMADYLAGLGFAIEHMPFADVRNLWAVHGQGEPRLVFAGHTDVVPPGPLTDWQTPPFEPTVDNGVLYGRGAADMKGSLAAMLTAASRFLATHADHPGSLCLLITSDEEADAVNGTRKVVEALHRRGEAISWCVVGEPSSDKTLGDVIRVGRRGSLNAILTIRGVQGHIAYPGEARNPIHLAAPAIAELAFTEWDGGNRHFPPTSMQISNIHAGTGANNVIPGSLVVTFNFRFSTESTADGLRQRTQDLLDAHGLEYDIAWSLSGEPFITEGGVLIEAVERSIETVLGLRPALSTSGGTSDGRFIAPLGSQVVELGPCNASIHKVNECVRIEELQRLSTVYASIMTHLLGGP
jgi:succinyl-diaminopimelate desuccinylase